LPAPASALIDLPDDHEHLRVAVDDAPRVCPDPIISRGASALSETLHRPPTLRSRQLA
jgi:hypothetical protein